MTLFRGNDDNALALLTKPAAEALERNGLTCTGRAADPPISVGVLVVIVWVKEYRRAVIEIQPEEYPVVITQLIRGKRKCRSHTGCQRIAPGLTFNVWIKGQNGKRG